MNPEPSAFLERCRDTTPGPYCSTKDFGNNGRFLLHMPGYKLVVMISDGLGWDHVSASVYRSLRTPSWEDMVFVKGLCFRDDEWAMQLPPPASKNRNYHPGCLHLWRPQAVPIPLPGPDMVAPKTNKEGIICRT